MARRFNIGQRIALYLNSGGRCAECGAELARGWHGDHRTPYSKGGKTDVLNGQALCPTCNLKKGASMTLPVWPADSDRNWQERCFRRYVQRTNPNFLVVATPGAGKTRLALKVAHAAFYAGEIDRLVVVCPTSHLRKQWADAASAFGIQLDPTWTNDQGAEPADMHGVVVTYQQVASSPDIHRLGCRRRTLVIFDEVHHAGEGNAWGNAMRTAFEPANARLLLSGTPFRSDNNPIPFITYDESGRSKSDFTYQYGPALSDHVCRPVLFPSYEGQMEWFSGDKVIRATFRDELSEAQARERLKTALHVKGEWLRTILKEANAKLSEMRSNGHPNAGGLIIARDQWHARDIAGLLYDLIGETAIVAISDDPDASKNIETYATGNSRWLIAVKMVSEGIDIPRLRVGVYATNTVTELFFRQAVGRFVRWIDGIEEQSAYFYIPREDVLIAFAQQIKDERDHELEEEYERIKRDRGEGIPEQNSLYAAISSKAQADDVIFDEKSLTQEEIEAARMLAQRYNIPAEVLARIFREHNTRPATPNDQPRGPTPEQSRYQQKEMQRKLIKRLVAQVIAASNGLLDHQTVNNRLMKSVDWTQRKDLTVDQLYHQVDILKKWIEEMRREC